MLDGPPEVEGPLVLTLLLLPLLPPRWDQSVEFCMSWLLLIDGEGRGGVGDTRDMSRLRGTGRMGALVGRSVGREG